MDSSLLAELWRRHVPHVLAAYLGGAWLGVEILEWLAARYSWPASLVDATFFALATAVPGVLIVTWFHGARGPDEWGRPEKIAIPASLTVMVAVFAWVYAPTPGPGPSVAVLPLENHSETGDDDYFARGMSSQLRQTLMHIDGLYVPGAVSSEWASENRIALSEIRATLKVGHVLSGTIRRRGDSLRISVDLVNAANGYRVWGETFDRNTEDLLAIQSDIAVQVANQLRGALLSQQEIDAINEQGTESHEAFELAAIAFVQLRDRTRDSECNAYQKFSRATDIDPGFADAWAGRAISLALMVNNFGRRACVAVDEANEQASVAVEKAMALNPESSIVWTAKAVMSQPLVPAGARRMNETPETVLQAVEALTRAVLLDPNNVLALSLLANAYEVSLEDAPTAIEYYELVLARDPLERMPRLNLADTLVTENRMAEAIAEVAYVLRNNPGYPRAWYKMADLLSAAGRSDEALLVFQRANAEMPKIEAFELGLAVTAMQLEDFELPRRVARESEDAEATMDTLAWLDRFESGDFSDLVGTPFPEGEPRDQLWWMLAMLQAGRYELLNDRIAALQPELVTGDPVITPENDVLGLLLAKVYARKGETEKCRKLASELLAATLDTRWQRLPAGQHVQAAALHVLLGNQASALEHLQTAYEQGMQTARVSPAVIGIFPVRLDHNVFFDAIHDHPQFIDLVARIDQDIARAGERIRSGKTQFPVNMR